MIQDLVFELYVEFWLSNIVAPSFKVKSFILLKCFKKGWEGLQFYPQILSKTTESDT